VTWKINAGCSGDGAFGKPCSVVVIRNEFRILIPVSVEKPRDSEFGLLGK
jgi:hypothetical protein